MIHLLSFDIGIKNMAYCYSTVDNDFKIIKIDKIDLNCNNKDIQSIITNTIDFLDSIMSDMFIIDDELVVLIECQMTSIMRCIQTSINTYFKIISKHQNMNIKTVYVSPKHKLKIIDKYSDVIATDKYKQNKIDAVYFTQYLLTTNYKNKDVLDYINSHKKKDDLSDAFLMCVYYYENKQ
jgi:hypothetical protein